MAFYAHSTGNRDRRDWQSLANHLAAVAGGAEAFGEPIGIGKAAQLAGFLHDLGKYTPAFQARLAGSRDRVDHSTAGAALVRGLAGRGDDAVIAELIAYAIAGHHAGLPDMANAEYACLAERLKAFDEAVLDASWRAEITPNAQALMPTFDFGDKASVPFRLALLGRMIFSCLVDADFKDTEAFYCSVEGRTVDREWPSLRSLLADLLPAFDRHMASFGKPRGQVGRLRGEILAHVRDRATEPPGLFTLTVPTGGGKTLASLGFALDHAKVHGLRRIIYAIPFTAIIDQTAVIFRQVLGEDVVLEHHSAIEDDRRQGRNAGEADSTRSDKNKLKLAMEDWAAPVVVTTNVQLFESLFAARPSRCRKLHNIANSVIVLDEAQTLPRHLLVPTVKAIDELARNYGCSIVLCTATQPAFDERSLPEGHPLGLKLEGRELAPDPPRLARDLKRVTLRHAGAMSDEALIEELSREPQALMIVNSRGHALALYRAAKAAGLDGLVHLTTRQYAAHRRVILEEVRSRLKPKKEGGGRPCRLIATSLVEAGIDLDFPKVWRAEAGLDQIAQAAGRCNREGKRPVEDSLVTIFAAPDNPPPSEIKGLTGDMGRMADGFDDLLAPAALEAYFGEVYWRVGDRLDRERILDDFNFYPRSGTDFAYRTVAEKYRMIESGMVPVIVEGDETAQKAVRDLKYENIPSGALARRLQTYTVQVPPKARALLLDNQHVAFIEPEKRGDQFAVLQTPSLYQEDVGLLWENADYLKLETNII